MKYEDNDTLAIISAIFSLWFHVMLDFDAQLIFEKLKVELSMRTFRYLVLRWETC